MHIKGNLSTGTAVTRTIGQIVDGLLDDTFTVNDIAIRLPTVSRNTISCILHNKKRQGIVEHTGTGCWKRLRIPFTCRIPDGTIAIPVWEVLRYGMPLATSEIIRQVAEKSQLAKGDIKKTVQRVLQQWRRMGCLVLSGPDSDKIYQQVPGILQRPSAASYRPKQ